MSHDEQTPGERLDQREKHVLLALIQDPFPWTVAELVRDMGKEGRWTDDAVAALDAAALVHRFVVLEGFAHWFADWWLRRGAELTDPTQRREQ